MFESSFNASFNVSYDITSVSKPWLCLAGAHPRSTSAKVNSSSSQYLWWSETFRFLVDSFETGVHRVQRVALALLRRPLVLPPARQHHHHPHPRQHRHHPRPPHYHDLEHQVGWPGLAEQVMQVMLVFTASPSPKNHFVIIWCWPSNSRRHKWKKTGLEQAGSLFICLDMDSLCTQVWKLMAHLWPGWEVGRGQQGRGGCSWPPSQSQDASLADLCLAVVCCSRYPRQWLLLCRRVYFQLEEEELQEEEEEEEEDRAAGRASSDQARRLKTGPFYSQQIFMSKE